MTLAANFVLLLVGAGLTGMITVFLSKAAFVFDTADITLLVALAMLVALCAAAFKGSAALRQVLALCLLSAAAAAIAAELTVAGPDNPSYADGGLGEKSAREALLDLRAAGERAYVSLLHADITSPDAAGMLRAKLKIDGAPVLPLSGVAGVKTILCNEAGQWITFASDRFGFRNPASSGAGQVDLAAVGDSYTQGNCVADGDSFVDRLRAAYPATVNLGQRGNGPFAILASIREYLAARRPKTILWFHYEGNDLPGDIQRERRTPLFQRYLEPGFTQNLRQRAPEVSDAFARYIDRRLEDRSKSPSPKSVRADAWSRITWSSFSLYQIRRRLGFANYPSRPLSETFEAVLKIAKSDVAQWNGGLILVYLPAKRRFTSTGARRDLNRYRSVVLAAAEALEIPVLDLSARFAALSNPASLFRRHFTEEGHALVAREVQNFLERRGL